MYLKNLNHVYYLNGIAIDITKTIMTLGEGAL